MGSNKPGGTPGGSMPGPGDAARSALERLGGAKGGKSDSKGGKPGAGKLKGGAGPIGGSPMPNAGEAARAALERLGGGKGGKSDGGTSKAKGAARQVAGDAASVASKAAQGAAGGTLATKMVGGGVQGAVLAGAGAAIKSKTGRNGLIAVGAIVGILTMSMMSSGDGARAGLTDAAVNYDLAYNAAEASGYNMENFQTVYETAGGDLLDWEMIAALEFWQANQNAQVQCPPTPPSDEDPVDPSDPEDPPENEDEPEVQINEAGDTAHPVTGSTYRVTSAFGTRIVVDGHESTNQGIDFGDEAGTELVNAAAGTVVYSGWNDTGGNMVWVDLADTEVPTQIRYLHMETANVAIDDELEVGDVVGWMGDSGAAERVILHFEVLENNEYVNPATWLEERDIEVNHGLPVDPRFSDPCRGSGGAPGQPGLPVDPGDGSYPGTDGFPGPPPAECPAYAKNPGVEKGIKAATLYGLRCTTSAFPDLIVTSTLGNRPPGYKSDHPMGLAVDYSAGMFEPGPGTVTNPVTSPAQVAPGMVYMYVVAHWTQVNADVLGVKRIIYGDMAWSPGQGWAPYRYPNGSTNPSTRHLDHVHVSYFESGGLPNASHLIPALTDGSGMPWQQQNGGAPWWRFVPLDDPVLDLSDFPRDGGGGIIIGDDNPGIGVPVGDYRSVYKIERSAFGPTDDASEIALRERLEEDPDFAREWTFREERGWVATKWDDAEELAVLAEEDFEYATEWVSFELARVMGNHNTIDWADLDSGRVVDPLTKTVIIPENASPIVTQTRDAYVDALVEMPVAGMNESGADAVHTIAQGWHFGNVATGGGSGNIPGVICAPPGDAVLKVQAVGGGRDGEVVVMDSKKLGYAATAVHVAEQAGVNDNGLKAMLMTIFQESTFQMYANSKYPESLALPHDAVGSDHSSAGLFQQLIEIKAWGPVESIMDVSRSSLAFVGASDEATAPGLMDIPGWEDMAPGVLAQKVQVSAYPHEYNQWEQAANEVLGAVKGIECTPEDDPDDPVDPGESSGSEDAAAVRTEEDDR